MDHNSVLQGEDVGALRSLDVFTAPKRAMTAAVHNRKWWLPFLVMVLVGSAYAMMLSRLGMAEVVRTYVAMDHRLSEQIGSRSSADQAEAYKAIETSLKVGLWASPLLTLLTNIVMALLLWGSLNLLLGGKATFGRLFTVLAYASLVQVSRQVLAIIVLAIKRDADGFDISNPVMTNAAPFVGSGLNPAFKMLVSSCDMITIWYVCVLCIGCSVAAKLTIGQAAIVVCGWWVVLVFARVGWAAVSG